ncbi:MAG: sel1 repeat family protein [Clostridia bacterium]|nr:sel1 repeat family protein [Clostridia bacterium]
MLEELTRERFIPAYDLLGNCYYNGEGCIKSPEKATQYYLYAHNSGYKNSTAHLALHYFLVNQNVKGQALIEECLKGDYGDVYGYAYFIKGYGYQFGKYGYPVDKAKALALYEAGAKELDIKSSYYAAVMYNVGIGCAVDHYKALKYFERAAMFDEAEAQYMTGKYYFNGEYVAINYDRAFAYFEQAFKNGHLAAKTYLGVCYLNGKGCWIDEDLGLRYIKEAASAGEPIAKKLLAKMNL